MCQISKEPIYRVIFLQGKTFFSLEVPKHIINTKKYIHVKENYLSFCFQDLL